MSINSKKPYKCNIDGNVLYGKIVMDIKKGTYYDITSAKTNNRLILRPLKCISAGALLFCTGQKDTTEKEIHIEFNELVGIYTPITNENEMFRKNI